MIEITYWGHACIQLSDGETTLIFDPFISHNPMATIKPNQVKCDYILVSRICDYGKKDKVCTRLNATYDNIKYLISESQIISYDIDHTHFKYEFFGFLKMGFKITKNPFKIIYSYLISKEKQKQFTTKLFNSDMNSQQRINQNVNNLRQSQRDIFRNKF